MPVLQPPKMKSFLQSVLHGGEPGLKGIVNRSIDWICGWLYGVIRRREARNGGRSWDL